MKPKKIRKIARNCLAVTLSPTILHVAGMREGDSVMIDAQKGKITIEKLEKQQ